MPSLINRICSRALIFLQFFSFYLSFFSSFLSLTASPKTSHTNNNSMDSTSYSTYTSSQDASPVRVNFARPLCFCGFTAVSIYPEPPSTTDRRSRSAQPPPPPLPPPLLLSPAVKKSNWVYECHFSPKQSGMMAPDPCEDCERERKRRTAQGSLVSVHSPSLVGVLFCCSEW